MYDTEYVLENETHKLLWDFEIQTDRLILTRRSDSVVINNNNDNNSKKTCRVVDLAVPTDFRVKLKESEKKVKY